VIPEYASLFDPLGTAWSDVLAGTKDPKTALDAAAKAYQPLLPGYTIG
jgi:arabinogalactan oligomer/maltooligosaccharide transport system substrate-binding protein